MIQLSKPGWYDISNEAYHSLPAISSSGVKKFIESKKKYYHKYVVADGPHEEYESKFLIGTCLHMMLLEPQKAMKLIASCPHRAGTKKYDEEVKIVWPDVVMDHPDNSLGRFMTESGEHVYMLNPSTHRQVMGMVRSAKEHKRFRKLSEPCTAELSGLVPYGNHWLACRGDLKSNPADVGPAGYFIDIKTIASLSDYNMQSQMFSFGYHIQHLHYLKVANLIDGPGSYVSFYFFFIEKLFPYECRLAHIDVSDNEMKIMQRFYDRKLDELINNIETSDFTEPDKEGVSRIRIPNYILEKFL